MPYTVTFKIDETPLTQTFERAEALKLIWRHTHRDFRSVAGAPKSILIGVSGATRIVLLEALSDAQIVAELKYAARKEYILKQTKADQLLNGVGS